MKKLYLIIAMSLFPLAIDAQNPEWVNYMNGLKVNCISSEANLIWIGTIGGLVKIDKTTGEKTFYNKANSALPGNSVNSIS
ncbi:MAG: hypothetical protein Q8903_06850, partial [Bacteroidota bacterium]|nr:hypothetical protein [Bacteroidota bacterium]